LSLSVSRVRPISYRKAVRNPHVRIVFATHAYEPAVGGAERYARGLAEAMAAANHDVHVITQNHASAEAFYEYGHEQIVEKQEYLNGVTIHRLPLEPQAAFLRTTRRGPIPDSEATTMWARYRATLRDRIADLTPTATFVLPHAFPNVAAGLESPRHGVGVYAPLLHEEDPAWRIEPIKSLISKTDLAVAMTAWERTRLSESYGAELQHTVVASPGVDSPDVASIAAHESPTPYVVSVGRRTTSKNLPVVTEAVAELRADGFDIIHVVAGPPGESGVDRSLKRFGDAVEIVGQIDEPAKWRLLKGAVASVSMSMHESFGIAAVESWRMGRPAVSRRTPVTTEVIDDGISGLLVDTTEELTTSLRHLLEHPDDATTLGAEGMAGSQRYSWERSAETVIEATERIMGRQ
jgi:glycosyltransferase involved in cell wall biosynthesis